MVVVLPDDPADLPAVERKLARNYADWLAALRPTLVDLWLPRWTSRSRLDLGAKLRGGRHAAGVLVGRRPFRHRQTARSPSTRSCRRRSSR